MPPPPLQTSASNTYGTTGAGGGNNTKKTSSERESVQSKLDLATALSHLGQANYQKAAYYFLRLGPVRELGDWAGKVRFSSSHLGFVIVRLTCGFLSPAFGAQSTAP